MQITRRGRLVVGSASDIEYLQAWYRRHCDGDWEHEYGVEVGTLDNPGWRLEVDLEATELEGKTLERHNVQRSDDDWWQAWCDGSKFHVAAGPENLTDAINAFRTFAESHSDEP